MLQGHSQYWQPEPPKNAIPPYFKGVLDHFMPLSRNPKALKASLFELLDEQKDPLTFALDLVSHGSTFYKRTFDGMLGRILKFLREWCEGHSASYFVTKDMKSRALILALECANGTSERHICKVFELATERESAKIIVHRLLCSRNFKKSYHIISSLDLEQEFDIKQCLFPLFFMELEQFVKQYLTKVPHYQIPFVTILDEICKDKDRLEDFVRSVNADGLYRSKTLSIEKYTLKKLTSFVELFNIDIKHCPNVYHAKVSKGMHYIFQKRFIEGSIEYVPWEELTIDLIAKYPDLQKELLVKLVCVNEAPAALRLAELFQIVHEDWPDALKDVPDSITKLDLDEKTDNAADNFLQLRLNRSDVHLVDTPKRLIEAVDDIAENYDIVGMDVEWKPDLGINFNKGLSKAALLQLAVWDSVYLFDITALLQFEDSSMWDGMLNRILCNKEIIKLGYGGRDDLKFLLTTIKVNRQDRQIQGYADLHTCFTKIQTNLPDMCEEIDSWFPACPSDKPEQKGLSQLCGNVLGKNLNKGEQFSNWERRPLRESQVMYAALDAFCLLMIYEKIYPLLKKRELDLEKVLISKPTPTIKKEKEVAVTSVREVAKKKKVVGKLRLSLKKLLITQKNVLQLKSEHTPVHISNFRVVVDNNVRGIIKYLRLLGADVLCLFDSQDNMDAVKIAQNQHRIVLTGRRQYEKVLGYLPEEMCFSVNTSLEPKSQVLQILEHFKVICEDSSLLSRCTEKDGELYLLDEPINCPSNPAWSTGQNMAHQATSNSGKSASISADALKRLYTSGHEAASSHGCVASNPKDSLQHYVHSFDCVDGSCQEDTLSYDHVSEKPSPKVFRHDIYQFEEDCSSDDNLDDMCYNFS